jgi:toxin CcdB
MSQFMAYKNINPSSKKLYPYVLDIQSDFLELLDTRLVIPLSLKSVFTDKAMKDLTPTISINGDEYILLTQQMAAIHKKNLGSFVYDCSESRHQVLSSIDFLITGY